MFVAMGLSAVFPVLHGVKLYGISEMQDRIGLTWVVLEGFLYILGAGLYAVSILVRHGVPEVLTSIGSMAGEIVARYVRHLGKLPSDISHACACSCYVAFVWPAQGFRLPPHCTRP
jgi:predicted membrane channel-forming protein YqfA (hemolysin III family)